MTDDKQVAQVAKNFPELLAPVLRSRLPMRGRVA
jgi:hypothetical protein